MTSGHRNVFNRILDIMNDFLEAAREQIHARYYMFNLVDAGGGIMQRVIQNMRIIQRRSGIRVSMKDIVLISHALVKSKCSRNGLYRT